MVGTWRFHCWAQAHSVPGQGAKSHKSCSAKKKKKNKTVADSSLVIVRVSSVNMTYHC